MSLLQRLAMALAACAVGFAALGFVPAKAVPQAESGSDLVPASTRVVLDNGLVLLLLEHKEVPVVNFDWLFRSGSIADPDGKEGLADLTMALLRKGTQKYASEQFSEQLDYLGGRLSLNASHEWCNLTAQFLSKDIEDGLALLQELVLHPTFPEAEVAKEIDLRVNALKEAKDNPRRVIRRYFEGLLFADNAFGRPVSGTETSLATIRRQDVVDYYERVLKPKNAALAVVGDFNIDDMRKRIDETFGSWQGEAPAYEPMQPKVFEGRRVLLVDSPDAVQTYFYIGNLGVPKGHADKAGIDVVNTVFGGRFTSWLMDNLRTKSGLTYNAHARFIERSVRGPFYISSFTQTATTEEAMDMALELLGRLHEQGLSPDEIESAQNYIRGQYPPDFETAGDLASAIVELEAYGLDRSTINEHTQKTDRVSVEVARQIISSHYPKQDFAIVMVGQADKIRDIAKKYGEVSEKKISDVGF